MTAWCEETPSVHRSGETVETKLHCIAEKDLEFVNCACEEPCAQIAQARLGEGPGPIDEWLK